MQIAIVGLPWSGKSTLFTTLAAYAGIEARPQAGAVTHCVVPVPDPRLDRLVEIFAPRKVTPATVDYLDVPGLDVHGAQGQGVPGTILVKIKNAAALVEVIGGFAEDQPRDRVARVGSWAAAAEALETEMLLGDLAIVEGRCERLAKQISKARKPEDERELELFHRCEAALSDGRPLRDTGLDPAEQVILGGYQLLTQKPLLRLVNTDEGALPDADAWLAAHWPDERGATPIVFSAALEAEIAGLPPHERATFLAEMGVDEPVLPRLLRASQELLGLVTFFTGGDKEVHAWPIRRGTRAREAAGTIHSDMERGFIRAEVAAYPELDAAGSLAACRESGTLRLEGRDYEVQDGDLFHVRFSV
jgi:GTP-binding protein YchF